MKQTKTMLRLELEVKPEMAAKCQLAAMAPMTALATGRRSILLTSRQISAAAVLDTLTITLLTALEQACGSCDPLCEEYTRSDENAEAVLQTIPTELLARLRKRGLCLRQLARHLVKGDTVYEA